MSVCRLDTERRCHVFIVVHAMHCTLSNRHYPLKPRRGRCLTALMTRLMVERKSWLSSLA